MGESIAIDAAHTLPFHLNLNRIAEIESGNRPWVRGRDGEVGLYQVSPEIIDYYNKLNNTDYEPEDAYNIMVCEKIADWYLHKIIPAMLRAIGKPVTVDNILIAYNAGISRVVSGRIPKTTKEYLRKYHANPLS